ncbi:hypothetical protein [Streptomyces sp. NPDC005799]|uniref:hypothetical protein n=1 Tax=Streptomyces sp. NPDC005799 TaxID=3154678 RepID=UPI0033FB2BEA
MEATNLLVATRGRDDQRVVSSIREVVDADDKQIVSSEVFRPGLDLRAVPGVPLRTETMQELEAAGFQPDTVGRPSGCGASHDGVRATDGATGFRCQLLAGAPYPCVAASCLHCWSGSPPVAT